MGHLGLVQLIDLSGKLSKIGAELLINYDTELHTSVELAK